MNGLKSTRPKAYDAIKSIQFSVLSADEISRGSVAEIVTHESTENKGGQTYNKMGGLYDPRLGTITRGVMCLTCEQPMETCPGHFGSTDLPIKCYHPEFMSTILLILRSVCLCCCKPRLPHAQFTGQETNKAFQIDDPRVRLLELAKNSPKKKNCVHCLQYLPVISKVNDKYGWTISCEGKTDTGTLMTYEITALRAHRILSNIPDSVSTVLGFDVKNTRPADLIWSVIAVPPPHLRPLITFDPMNKGQDDTTTSLYNILKNIHALKDAMQSSPEDNVRKCADILSFQLRAMVNNDEKKKPTALQRSGRPLVGTKQRLEGKEGRFRNNLSGKRVNFSARTVITPDPNIDLDHVGVPYEICMNLTVPETVTEANRAFLQYLVQQGPGELLGANYLERVLLSGALEKIDLSIKRKYSLSVSVGDIIHRHLMDIDYILFNRQPSLHRMSMMAHKVIPLPGRTFRLNPSVTTPYNADFDGDEMNLHASQSIAARSESRHIMHVPKQIITPQSNRPIISLVQDTLLSAPILSSRTTLFTQAQVFALFQREESPPSVHRIPPAVIFPKRLYTGKQVFSMILPGNTLNLTKFSSTYPDLGEPRHVLFSPTDTQVIIRNSQLISGILDKQTLGSSDGSLIHILSLQFSNDHTAKFINSIQRILDAFMQMHGYSIGVSDVVIPEDLQQQIRETIRKGHADVAGIIEKAQGKGAEMESAITVRLGQVRDVCGRLVQQCMTSKSGNSIVNMVNSGSKGSSINSAQIMACVGPQEVLGKRIQLTPDGRTLPYFHKGSLSPESRGMVNSPFIFGLSVSEFYYHMMAGREGMIDTAVKTSDTGYIQRRLFKSMEPLLVEYDGTVRNAQGKIIQYSYGDDSMNACALESVTLSLYGMSDREFQETYCDPTIPAHNAQLEHDRIFLTKTLSDKKYHSPVNIPRVVSDVTSVVPHASPLNYSEAVTWLSTLETELAKCGWGDPVQNANQISLLMVYIRSELSPKKADTYYHLSAEQFSAVLARIIVLYSKALIEPGESVGGIAAQSIGEPATQMTLNSVAPWEGIMIKDSLGGVHLVSIGEFIDTELKRNPKKIQHIPQNRTEYLELKYPVKIAAPDAQGNVNWETVTAVTKHLPVGDLVYIKTRSGREVTATQSKSILVWDAETETFVQRDGNTVVVGDFLPVISRMPEITYPGKVVYDSFCLDYNFGSVVGAYVSVSVSESELEVVLPESTSVIDFCRKNAFAIRVESGCIHIKSSQLLSVLSGFRNFIPSHLMTAPLSFVSGFTDNYVEPQGRQSNFYTAVAWMFSRLGIYKALNSSRDCPETRNDVVLDPIVSIEFVPATEFVYDLTVPVTTNFSLWNGLGVADTFHFAGVSSQSQVTTGVPRLNEIINLSRKFQTPSMKIYLNKTGDPHADLLTSQLFQHSIGIKTLGSFITSTQVVKQESPFSGPDIDTQALQLFYSDDITSLLCLSQYHAEIHIDPTALIIAGVLLNDITQSIYDTLNDKVLVRVTEIPAFLVYTFPDLRHTLKIYFLDSNFSTADDQQDIIKTVLDNILQSITVTGLQGITRVYPVSEKDNSIETGGVNMTSLFANPAVDYTRTTTNDIFAVLEELGIEAARACILRELTQVLTFGGKYVNVRHLTLLVDTMCNSGLMSITRHGMNRKKSGVLMRASFEETLSVLVSAAIFSEKDYLVDVTSNIMLGKLARIGTGFFDVVLDTDSVIGNTGEYQEVNDFLSGIQVPDSSFGFGSPSLHSESQTLFDDF